MRYLVIDTCTERGVIAYGTKDEILFEQELPFGLNQSKFLMPALTEALKPYGAVPEMTAIGAGIGPGSYTGIRIGVAIAQALAYCWKVPLIGLPSLQGFIPSEPSVCFATVIDARIGGLYFQKGKSVLHDVSYEGLPQICPLQEAGTYLEGVSHLLTPSAKSLQAKLCKLYPDQNWVWEERGPSAKMLLLNAERKHGQGELVVPPQHLDLLYLRQTEAEREQLLRKGSHL